MKRAFQIATRRPHWTTTRQDTAVHNGRQHCALLLLIDLSSSLFFDLIFDATFANQLRFLFLRFWHVISVSYQANDPASSIRPQPSPLHASSPAFGLRRSLFHLPQHWKKLLSLEQAEGKTFYIRTYQSRITSVNRAELKSAKILATLNRQRRHSSHYCYY